MVRGNDALVKNMKEASVRQWQLGSTESLEEYRGCTGVHLRVTSEEWKRDVKTFGQIRQRRT